MNNRRQTTATRLASTLAIVVLLMGLPGCASNEPTITGFGLGSSRTVSVGDSFELRLPVARDGSRLWRVTSYDSYYLTLAGNARTESKSKGAEIVIPVLARQSGETTIEVTQRLSAQDRIAGKVATVKKFNVRIVP